MTKEEVIKLGTQLGLPFNEKTNFPDALAKGRVVFDGCNGQRFLIESSWEDEEIIETLGKSLIIYGRRLQKMDINRALNINSD
jgi:hypothetical protein